VRLQGADEWKLRVGDYRALAYLSFEDRRVTVARVLHRSAAYKR
jgi:mRNA-degrading endonuclease RelE of RelBE toxin-antitoxin system